MPREAMTFELSMQCCKMAELNARKRKRNEAHTTYLQGTSRKAHSIREGLKLAIVEQQSTGHPGRSTSGLSPTSKVRVSTRTECQLCKPVLES